MYILLLLFVLLILSAVVISHIIRGFYDKSEMFISQNQLRAVVWADPYFARMSNLDLTARGATTINGYRDKYVKCCVGFTESEKAELISIVESLPNEVVYYDVPIKLKPCRYVKLRDGCENNWPHTIGDVICLPENFFYRTDKRKVIMHEQIHVWQRMSPLMFVVVTKMGFEPTDFIYKSVCNNPDTDGRLYARDGVVSDLVFSDTKAPSMKNTEVKVIYGDESAPADNHPNEIMATEISSNIEKYTPEKYTPEKYTPEKYTPEKYTKEKYTKENFGTELFTKEFYTREKYTPEKFTNQSRTMFTPEKFTPAQFARGV